MLDGVILHLVMVKPIYINCNKVWQEINKYKPLEAKLSKSGSYVESWKVGEIVDCRIGSWIVRSYII